MYLLDKYGWKRFFEYEVIQSEFATYLAGNNPPNMAEVASDAKQWITELFAGRQYNRDSIALFNRRPEFIKDFIRYEIFNEEDGVIKIILPEGKSDQQEDYKLITAVLLFYLHFRQNDIKRPFRLQNFIAEFFESLNPFNEPYTLIPFNGKKYTNNHGDYPSLSELVNDIYKILMKTSFAVNNEQDPIHREYAYSGRQYFEGDPECLKVTLNIIDYEDYLQNTFADYIRYLLTENRNKICSFKSSDVFWNKVVRISRRNGNLELYPQPDKVLLLFCIALGLSSSVFERLKILREQDFGNKQVNVRILQIYETEKKVLFDMLKDNYRLLQKIKCRTKNVEDIPRKMLIEANKKLLSLNTTIDTYRPVIEIETNETEEYQNISKQILGKFYDEIKKEETGQTIMWKFK